MEVGVQAGAEEVQVSACRERGNTHLAVEIRIERVEGRQAGKFTQVLNRLAE